MPVARGGGSCSWAECCTRKYVIQRVWHIEYEVATIVWGLCGHAKYVRHKYVWQVGTHCNALQQHCNTLQQRWSWVHAKLSCPSLHVHFISIGQSDRVVHTGLWHKCQNRMTVSTENATPPQSTKSRNPNSSAQIQRKPNDWIYTATYQKIKFLDSVDFGGVYVCIPLKFTPKIQWNTHRISVEYTLISDTSVRVVHTGLWHFAHAHTGTCQNYM